MKPRRVNARKLAKQKTAGVEEYDEAWAGLHVFNDTGMRRGAIT